MKNSFQTNFYRAILLLIILFCPANLAFGQNKFYLSNDGDNEANGNTPQTAWKDLSKFNSLNLLPGDSVFFRAGDTWRDVLKINESGAQGSYIYFGRYGDGKNPRIVGSEKAIDWTLTSTPNVWQTATPLTNFSDDYYGGRLFFEVDDTTYYGDYKVYNDLTELVNEFDYTVNGTTHYVYSLTDPDIAYDAVEVTQREQCVSYNFSSYIVFDGLDVRYSKRQGYFEGYPSPRGVTNLVWKNLFVGFIGAKGSGSAYGITAFASNILIENCTFQDNGRRAISINTYSDNPGGRRIENIIIRNNVFKRGHHTTSLDLSTMNRDGDTVMNVYFYNNIIDDHDIDTLGDWGNSNQLFTQAGIGSSLMTGIYIIGNVFNHATARNVQLENGVSYHFWNNTVVGHNVKWLKGSPYGNIGLGGADTVDFRNNIGYCNLPDNDWENNILHDYRSDSYFTHLDYNLYYSLNPKNDRNVVSMDEGDRHYFFRSDQWADYKSSFPLFEVNSPEPANPEFADMGNFDFRLSSGSPAKYVGTVLPDIIITDPFGNVEILNKYDINGNPRDTVHPSLGAFEYIVPDPAAADIVFFVLENQSGNAIINTEENTVQIEVNPGTGLTSLKPYIGLSIGATIEPGPEDERDFTTSQTYTVTASDGVTIKLWTVTVTEQPLSVESFSPDNSIFVYPNPAKDHIFIKTPGTCEIRLMNSAGIILYENSDVNGTIQLPVNYCSGLYIVQVIHNQKTYSRKFIIE
ncbi:MAG: T9SS type A sorting domain-containing protein [Bacteroidales bacterium]|nr:T9SS type A sorting domain-containing protein [Bacteroidales bacterium]